MKNTGISIHRLKQNPLEKIFAEEWEEENRDDKTLKYILSARNNYPVYVEDRERIIAATVIQWLGSPVGQGFLRKVMKDCF